jgi:hypothetical protein
LEKPSPTFAVSSFVESTKESLEVTSKKSQKSIIDLPIIDILVPKGSKKQKSKSNQTKNGAIDVQTQALQVKVFDINAPPESQVNISVVKEINSYDPNMFKGLDPEFITKTDKYPSKPVETPKIKIVREEENSKQQESELKEEDKQLDEVNQKNVEIPSVPVCLH